MIPTAWILSPLAVIAVLVAAVLIAAGRLSRRRSDQAWAGDVARNVRRAEKRAAEVALLERLYAMESAGEQS